MILMLLENKEKWYNLAELCLMTYDTQVDWEEEFFVCPECGEPIYMEDWGNHESMSKYYCPVCEYSYANDFMEEGAMEEEAEWGTF